MHAAVGERLAPLKTRAIVPANAAELKGTWGARHPLAAGFAASSLSVASGVLLTNWIDVIKVRQQLAGGSGANLLATGVQLVRQEGLVSLMHGVTPAVTRGLLYGGLRIGLYTPFKQALSSDGADPGLGRKVAAGMASGALAAGLCNPTDLVKTRMQARGASGQGPLAVGLAVVREEGWLALWKGTTPSMARASLLTASQCASYDQIKLYFVRRLGWADSVGTHLAVSTLAGLITTTVTAPADMIKTHMFVGGGAGAGLWRCVEDIHRRHGAAGFFRGWAANWARQGPMTTAVFVVSEAIRPALGLGGL